MHADHHFEFVLKELQYIRITQAADNMIRGRACDEMVEAMIAVQYLTSVKIHAKDEEETKTMMESVQKKIIALLITILVK